MKFEDKLVHLALLAGPSIMLFLVLVPLQDSTTAHQEARQHYTGSTPIIVGIDGDWETNAVLDDTNDKQETSSFTADTSDWSESRLGTLRGNLPVQRQEEGLAGIQAEVGRLDGEVRRLKRQGVVMETDPDAATATVALQAATRKLLGALYGPGPYFVRMELAFPEAIPGPARESIVIRMAPIELVPHSVYQFLRMTGSNWHGGAFHRRAAHVLQAMVNPGSARAAADASMAWQEYHPGFPHKPYTLGFAGRPGGPAFYISTLDNTRNHGPGSQGSSTEADSAFGKIEAGLDVVKRLQQMKGGEGLGFLPNPKDHVRIDRLDVMSPEDLVEYGISGE